MFELSSLTFEGLIAWGVVPAIVFTIAYPSILKSLTLGLVSPYSKANVRKRLYAGALDGLVAALLLSAFTSTGRAAYLALACAYVLMRDSVGGQSLGKFVAGLVVVNIESGGYANWRDSTRRNIVFLLPGANVAAVVLEGRTLLIDPQGQRLGDRFANTQVVEGAGAAELLKDLQRWLAAFDAQLGSRQRHGARAPIQDKAA